MGEKSVQARPFVKWAGGKRSIIKGLLSRVPKNFDSYEEPFLGGGALFFALKPKISHLSDINSQLISSYIAIRDNVDLVIGYINDHAEKHSENHYYRTRGVPKVVRPNVVRKKYKTKEGFYFLNKKTGKFTSEKEYHEAREQAKKINQDNKNDESFKCFVEEPDIFKLAAKMIYLNKACYNGIYRVNQDGNFNVPMGKKISNKTIKENRWSSSEAKRNEVAAVKGVLKDCQGNLRKVSKVLQNCEMEVRSFTDIKPRKNVFYYLDPPYYSPEKPEDGEKEIFTNYTHDGFGEEKHQLLAKKCKEIHEAGGFFMLSNSDNDFVRSLYDSFVSLETIMAGRSISQKASQRGKEGELIIRNYE